MLQKETFLFKVLSDATRLRLALLLLANGETCVCILAQALDAPDFKISRHLGVMRSAKIVQARREGTWMYYRLVEPQTSFERSLQDFLRSGLIDHPIVKQDLDRLSHASCSKNPDKKGNIPPSSRCAQ